MKNCNWLCAYFRLSIVLFGVLFLGQNSYAYDAEPLVTSEDACWVKLWIKNEGCATGKVYKYEYGHYTYMRDLRKGESVRVNAQKGSEWLISDGKTTRKSHKVSTCYDHSMKFDLGGCESSSDGSYCAPTIKFKNSHCGALSIHSMKNGSLEHLATITPHSHWSTKAAKGSIWVVKEGHKEMQKWKVPSCYEQIVDLKYGSCHTTSSDCKSKLVFRNNYCHTLSIFHKSNGHMVLKKELAPGVAWGVYSKIGHEWVVKRGYTTMKNWKVPSCKDHNIHLDFDGCGSMTTSSDCHGQTTFYNKNCSTLSLYKEHNGRLYHRKDLSAKSHWTVSTSKGENWTVKEGHSVKKNWTATSCKNQNVHLDFGGCHTSSTHCESLLGFYNENCEMVSIYKESSYGKLTHMKDLNHLGYWRTNAYKGENWVVRQGSETKKSHHVDNCYNINLKLDFGGCKRDLCDNGEEKKTPGTKCNDYDSNTYNDVIQEDGCTCAGEKQTTTNSCEKSYTDFESGWGDWYDGGSNCVRYNDPHGPMKGHHAIRIRDNKGWSSSTYSVAYNMSGHSAATVDFMYMATGMKYGAMFALEYSTNDGKTWYKARKWEKGKHYNNNQVYNESVTFKAYFGRKTRFRMRSYASGASSYVHLDNIRISSCHSKGFSSEAESEVVGKSWATTVAELNVYPNPVDNVMRVSGLSSGESFSIFDIAGREVISNQNDAIVNTGHLKAGAYLIKTNSGQVKRFIKK